MLLNWIAFGMLVLVAAAAAVTDVRQGKVYNALTYPAIAVGLTYWLAVSLIAPAPPGPALWLSALVALAAGVVPFALLRWAGGVGGGDVKLMGAVGAISAAWQCVLATAVYALLVGLVIGLGIMVYSGRTKQTLARLMGLALSSPTGSRSELTRADSPQVPFGLAIGLGAVLAGAETLLGWHSPWAWLSL